jgi:CubicO group peptidase (beta-lactamase class C family)
MRRFLKLMPWLIVPVCTLPGLCAAQEPRLRVIVETDAGGDPDDEQSLVRFLVYTNEWDVEGIIANRPRARDAKQRGTNATLLASPDKTHGTASLAKAIVGGLSLSVAMSDGRIGLDDPAAKFIPQWRGDPRRSRITLRQFGSHTSGIEDAEADGEPHEQLTGWKGDFWKRLAVPNDPFTIARDRASLLFEPGEKMQYSNPGIALMTYCVTAAMRDAPQKDVLTLLRDHVMRPIGVPDAQWSVGYGKTYTVDGLPLVGSWGGGNYTSSKGST